jgi:serine-aspartate repeat-containing protein C/D/E
MSFTTLTGLLWNDSNNNGEQDNGEKVYGGITVSLATATGETIMTTKSYSNCTWMLKNFVPATYIVKVDLPSDVVLTCNGKTELTVTITNETMKVLLMPTTVILGSVEGIVFYDTNGGTTLGNSESFISSTVVTLKDSNGVIIATSTSDSSGKYVFNNVMP